MEETFQCPSCVCPTDPRSQLDYVPLHLNLRLLLPTKLSYVYLQDPGYLITTAEFEFGISTCI